jgi:hypothetical protein
MTQRERSRRWYLANKKRSREQGDAWRKANPDAFRAIQRRAWRKAHPDAIPRLVLTPQERLERQRQRSREWWHRNKGLVESRRRARMENDPVFRDRRRAYIRAMSRKYRLVDPEREQAKQRRNYLKYREKKIAYSRAWRSVNRERHLYSVMRWQRDNPELVREYRRRAATKRSAAVAFLVSKGLLPKSTRGDGIRRAAAVAFVRAAGLLPPDILKGTPIDAERSTPPIS